MSAGSALSLVHILLFLCKHAVVSTGHYSMYDPADERQYCFQCGLHVTCCVEQERSKQVSSLTESAMQVLLFPAMKPEDQKAGALTSAAPPSAVQHPGPSSSLVTHFLHNMCLRCTPSICVFIWVRGQALEM